MVFKFRFEKILEYKTSIEEEKKKDYAILISKENALKQDKEKFDIQRQEMQVNLLDSTLTLQHRNYLLKYLSNVSLAKRRIDEQINLLTPSIEKARVIFLDARKEKEKFVKLREIKYEEYKYAQKKKEQKQLDEFGSEFHRQKTLKSNE